MEEGLADDGNPKSPSLPHPFKKLHQKKTHSHKPKFERGRRACSENPPTRTELVKLTGTEEDKADHKA